MNQQSASSKIIYPEGLSQLGTILQQFIKEDLPNTSNVLLVVDHNVRRIYEEIIKGLIFTVLGLRIIVQPLKDCESNKTMKQVEEIHETLFSHQFTRKDLIIAIGGGICTDLTGFAASIYLRGVPFILIPTTLLSMVDAAFGGKTGVNNSYGKNQVGTITEPLAVIVIYEFLLSLNNRQLANGMAEVIKGASICDIQFFELLEQHVLEDLKKPIFAQHVIQRSIQIKIDIVSQDKFEQALREILNFGHTFGHAIEITSKDQLLHGECVSMGMILACQASLAITNSQQEAEAIQNLLNRLSALLTKQIIQYIERYDLPITIPGWIDTATVLEYLHHDKKIIKGNIRFILLQSLGKAYPSAIPIPLNIVESLVVKHVQIEVPSSSGIDVEISTIPGSKSITNRLLLISALGQGEVVLNNFSISEDTSAMLQCLRTLGFISKTEMVSRNSIRISGSGGRSSVSGSHISVNVGDSGTTARFITPLCLMTKGFITVQGGTSIRSRPMKDLLTALKIVNIEYKNQPFHLPFAITASGEWQGGRIQISGRVSSQYVSAILMAAPYALEPVELHLTDNSAIPVSEPFITMTLKLMEAFGIKVERPSTHTFIVPIGIYKNPEFYDIEPDATAATYDMAQICLCGGSLSIASLNQYSVQGDIRFVQAIEQLGAAIEFNDNSVRIQCTKLKSPNAVSLDCSDITDTFITLSIIVCTIQGRHRIYGIENQRVKECNRITGVVKNLSRCGIICKELSDGLEIFGDEVRPSETKNLVMIKTYGDHRMAMAFAMLANYYYLKNHRFQLVIDNKDCVGKTFPGFWRHIKQYYGIQVASAKPEKLSFIDPYNLQKQPLIFVGMRGAGKSTISRHIASKLGWMHYSTDRLISTILKEKHNFDSIAACVEAKGWPLFRDIEKEVVFQTLQTASQLGQNCVIDCGGGVIERETMSLLRHQANVIYVEKSLEEIELIAKQQLAPALSATESLVDIFIRRRPNYLKVCNYILTLPKFMIDGDIIEHYKSIEQLSIRFVKKFLNFSYPDHPIYMTPSSFATCFIEDIYLKQFPQINKDCNCLELRLDKFIQNSPSEIADVSEQLRFQIAQVKTWCKIPLILTIRSVNEGGYFDSSNGRDSFLTQIFKDLLKSCLGDLIDVELEYCLTQEGQRFLRKASTRNHTRLILSKHYIPKNPAVPSVMIADCERMKELHLRYQQNVQLLKIVVHEEVLSPELVDIYISNPKNFTVKTNYGSYLIPHLILPMGQSTQLARLSSDYLTPLALFSTSTAPGQISVQKFKDIQQILGGQSTKDYHLFGTRIQRSPSDRIHNGCFSQMQGLSGHHYNKVDTAKFTDVVQHINRVNFKGASITIPFKKQIVEQLNFISSEVDLIGGVVNTVVSYLGHKYGFNTDWWGIYYPVVKSLKFQPPNDQTCIIIGYGATAQTAFFVAYHLLRMRVVLIGRHEEKLKQFFQERNVSDGLEYFTSLSLCTNKQVHLIINTLPSDIDLQVPETLITLNKPIVFFASYGQCESRLRSLAMAADCRVIDGFTMLAYQAIGQVQLFNGKPPRSAKFIKDCLSQDSG